MPMGWGAAGTRPLAMPPLGPVSSTMGLRSALYYLAAEGQSPVITAEFYDPATGQLRFAVATEAYSSLPTDLRANLQFEGRLDKPPIFDRTFMDGNGFRRVASSVGELEINNADKRYDADIVVPLDGMRVIVRLVWRGTSFNTAVSLFAGNSLNGHIDQSTFRLELEDDSAKLDIQVSANVYAGTGSQEGDSNIKGKRKPRVFGFRKNVPCVLIDSTNLVYQVNDGPVQLISEIRDDGAPIGGGVSGVSTYAELALAGGAAPTCSATGMFKLGAQPSGVVTATVYGQLDTTNNNTYMDDTATIIKFILKTMVPSLVVNYSSLAALHTAQPASVDYYVGIDDSTTVRKMVEDLMGGAGGWISLKRDGVLQCGIVSLTPGASVATYGNSDIVFNSFARLKLPSEVMPPPWRQQAIISKNDVVQTVYAGIVGPDNVNLYSQPYVLAPSSPASLGTAILAAHPRAQDPPPMETCFSFLVDGVPEATRVLVLWSGFHSLYQFTLSSMALVHDIGETITLGLAAPYDRFDLASGKLGLIVATHDDTKTGRASLTMLTYN